MSLIVKVCGENEKLLILLERSNDRLDQMIAHKQYSCSIWTYIMVLFCDLWKILPPKHLLCSTEESKSWVWNKHEGE